MTDRNPYVDLCIVVQAIRREVERIRTPLAPAMGVSASIYTHQIANTLRILSDLRVRHLLADEVGLGKTVQALMVLNALKSQRSDLRALVIVPDRLVPQWRDEILTRAHTAPTPIEEDTNFEGAQYIRLAWEDQLRETDAQGIARWSLSDINSNNYEVLVVDELHRLKADVQDRIVRAASTFEHVLILTATPAFQHPDRHAQLFAMLEPERCTIERWKIALSGEGIRADLSVNDDLSTWPKWALRSIVENLLEHDRLKASSCSDNENSRQSAALAHCAYRRVIRTRRIDYSGVLPQRRHIPIVVEPLGVEADRQELMWRYFAYLDQLSRHFDPVLLAKRVILSPPSLEQRVDFLRRKGHERDGLLESVKPLVHRSQGDSRLDALVDLLALIWTTNPAERILVAAQDNLTVDYLFDLIQARLPLIGPLDRRVQLVAARIRQGMMTEAVKNLGGYGNETNENLEAFQRGEAQLLLAPEAAQVGLNLQCARILILYSVPWRPEEVEQWIGRLDRIGNLAVFSKEGEARFVDVYTIVQRGLIDEKVVEVLQHFHVFRHSVNLDGEYLSEVAKRIERAALEPQSASWNELEDATEAMAAKDEVQELDSHLRPWLPWSIEWAKSLRQQIETMRPVEPVLIKLPEYSKEGPHSWDRALEGMVKLLKRASEYHIRWNNDPDGNRFRTLWYYFGEFGVFNYREVQSNVIFTFGADPGHERSPRHAFAFITRRGDIKTPPRRHVTMLLEQTEFKRPLHFFNYGDPLHDELIKGWVKHAESINPIDVMLFDDHDFFSTEGPGLYFFRFSVLDPAAALMIGNVDERAIETIIQAATLTIPEKLPELLSPFIHKFHCALEADVRWLRTQFSAEFHIKGLHYRQDQWSIVDTEKLINLLNPVSHDRNGVPRSSTWHPSATEIDIANSALEKLRKTDESISMNTWSHRLPFFEQSLKLRQHTIIEETRDAELLAKFELDEAKDRVQKAREHGNQSQISRAETVLDASKDNFEMTRAFCSARVAWLEEISTSIRSLSPIEYVAVLIRVRRA